MRIHLAILLLLTASASAQTIEWHGDSEGAAMSPMFLGYSARADDGSIEGHVNVALRAELNGELLLDTQFVHEHEGLHTFTLMAPDSGVLTLTAIAGGMEYTQSIDVSARPLPAVEALEESYLRVFPAPQTGNNFYTSYAPAVGLAGPQAWAFAEAVNEQGTLRAAGWISSEGQGVRVDDGAWTVGGFATDDVFLRPGNGAALLAPINQAATSPSTQPILLPGVPRPVSCAETEFPVLLDPNSISPAGTLQFQQHSALRVTMPDHPYSEVSYLLFSALGPLSQESVLGITTVDSFAQATLLPGAVGNWRLLAAWDEGEAGSSSCELFFDVVANQQANGTTEVEATVDGTRAIIAMSAEAEDAAIGHYEFDTRVIRLADDRPGYLAWMGKLHGHAGAVEVTLDSLPSGDYQVWTHPSPQNLDSAPVSTPAPVHFTIASESGPFQLHAAPVQEPDEKKAGIGLLLVPLALLALASQRRT